MSYNHLGSTGAELLLKCLKVSMVTDLNLTATVQSYHINHMTKHLTAYTRLVSSEFLVHWELHVQ